MLGYKKITDMQVAWAYSLGRAMEESWSETVIENFFIQALPSGCDVLVMKWSKGSEVENATRYAVELTNL